MLGLTVNWQFQQGLTDFIARLQIVGLSLLDVVTGNHVSVVAVHHLLDRHRHPLIIDSSFSSFVIAIFRVANSPFMFYFCRPHLTYSQ
jgi:hypothetical protein